MKYYSIFLSASLLLLSCQGNERTEARNERAAQEETVSPTARPVIELLGTYTGTMPCADCEGVLMELTLEQNQAGDGRTYTLRETYQGSPEPENVVESRGTWSIQIDSTQASSNTMLTLSPEDNRGSRYAFRRVRDTELHLLNPQGREIERGLNYSLQKQRQ